MRLMHVLVGAAVMASGPAFASKDLAQKNACLGCHVVDRKIVGPSFQSVATKYAGQKDAENQLTESIKKGGAGKWGPVPMPAQAALSQGDASTLAAWVLAGAK